MAIGDIAEALQSEAIEVGEGIIGSLVQSGRAEFINDTGADPRALQIAGTPKAEDERLMVAPLLAGKTVKGVMAVWRTGGQPFADSDLEFLVGLSLQATVAIENARLFAESQQRAAELATINTVSQQLGSKLELAELLELVGEQIRTVFKADLAYVALLEPVSGIIHFPYQYGESEYKPLKFGEGLTSRIIASRKPLIINNEADRQSHRARREGRRPPGAFVPGRADQRGRHVPRRDQRAEHADRRRLRRRRRAPAVHDRRQRRRRAAERAAVQRDAGGARPPDGHRRHPARDQQLADRRAAGVRRDRRHGRAAARRATPPS